VRESSSGWPIGGRFRQNEADRIAPADRRAAPDLFLIRSGGMSGLHLNGETRNKEGEPTRRASDCRANLCAAPHNDSARRWAVAQRSDVESRACGRGRAALVVRSRPLSSWQGYENFNRREAAGSVKER